MLTRNRIKMPVWAAGAGAVLIGLSPINIVQAKALLKPNTQLKFVNQLPVIGSTTPYQ